MSELKDRVKGAADETIGKAKRAIGRATDRPDIEAEGGLQQAKGNAESAIGKLKGAVHRATR